MIATFLLSIITSQLAGLLAGGAGFAIMGGLALSLIGPAWQTAARVAALALVCWFAYSWGYRSADNRAQHATTQLQIRILKADANLQRLMRANAQSRLKEVAALQAELSGKVSKYEEELEVERSKKPVPGRVATDHDIRRLRAIR